MPIEYAAKSGMESPMGDETMSEETVDIPSTILQGKTASPGDVVRLEIVSVDDESGMVTLKYATEKPSGGISEAAAQFEA